MVLSNFRLSVLSLVLFLLFITGSAQTLPRWDVYGEILTGNNVNDVAIDSDGRVWILSNSRLLQLENNEQFVQLTEADELGPNHIETDPQGDLWLVSENNFQFNGNHLAFSKLSNGVITSFLREDIPGFPNFPSNRDDNITSFLVDGAGVAWFGFENGDLGKYDLSGTYTHYPNTLINGEEVRDIAFNTSTGNVYAAIYFNVYKLSPAGNWTLVTESWTNSSFIEAVEVDGSGNVFFGGYNGLHVRENMQISTFNTNNSQIRINIIDDIKIIDGTVLFSGNDGNGVDYVQTIGFDLIHKGKAESNRVFDFQSTLLEDPTNSSLWLGTDEDGLVNITISETLFYNNQTISLPDNQVNNVAFVGNQAYISTNGGLTLFEEGLFSGIHPYFSSPAPDIAGDGKTNKVLFDGEQYLYIATDSGLSIQDLTDQTFNSITLDNTPGLSEERFFTVFDLGEGRVIGLTLNYLVSLDNGQLINQPIQLLSDLGLPSGNSWQDVIPERNSGGALIGFWVAGSGGLHYYDFNTAVDFNSELYSFNVSSMTEGPDGTLWLGFKTFGDDLQTFDKVNTWNTITLPDLSDLFVEKQDVVGLEFDANGTLWIAANYSTCSSCRAFSLLKYDGNDFQIIDRDFNSTTTAKDLTISPVGAKWISLNTGLYAYSDDSYSNLDPCTTVQCPVGTVCQNGECIPETDPCQNVSCPADQVCYEGSCYSSCTPDAGTCFGLGDNQVAPPGSAITLDAGPGYDIYQWSTGETTQSILADASGRYWFIAYDNDALIFSSDTIDILIEANPITGCPEGFTERDGYCFPEDDPCAGVSCPEGQVCYAGSCYNTNLCTSVSCPEGQVCYAGSCYITPDCTTLLCPPGQICRDGQCFQGCAFDSDCPEGTICAVDICVTPEEACSYLECPDGNLCVYGECYPLNLTNTGNRSLSGSFSIPTGILPQVRTASVSDITIYLFDQDQTEIRGIATTDEQGNYSFTDLPLGTYKVFVDSPPYRIQGDALVELRKGVVNTGMDIELNGDLFQLFLDYVTGISTNLESGSLIIYPNPSSGRFTLSSSLSVGEVEIRVRDLAGREIMQLTTEIDKGYECIIDLEEEPEGMKFLEMYQSGKIVYRQNIVIQK